MLCVAVYCSEIYLGPAAAATHWLDTTKELTLFLSLAPLTAMTRPLIQPHVTRAKQSGNTDRRYGKSISSKPTCVADTSSVKFVLLNNWHIKPKNLLLTVKCNQMLTCFTHADLARRVQLLFFIAECRPPLLHCYAASLKRGIWAAAGVMPYGSLGYTLVNLAHCISFKLV